MEKLKHKEKRVSKKTRQELIDKGSFKNSRFRCHSQILKSSMFFYDIVFHKPSFRYIEFNYEI